MKEYILKLDHPRRLKFGFRAIRLIREKFGDRDVSDLLNLKIDEMPAVAWAGLVHEDKDLTLEKTEELLDAAIPENHTILDIINIVIDAISEQVGAQKKTIETKSEEPGPPPSGSESAATSSKT